MKAILDFVAAITVIVICNTTISLLIIAAEMDGTSIRAANLVILLFSMLTLVMLFVLICYLGDLVEKETQRKKQDVGLSV